jgi:hypothetical protein
MLVVAAVVDELAAQAVLAHKAVQLAAAEPHLALVRLP